MMVVHTQNESWRQAVIILNIHCFIVSGDLYCWGFPNSNKDSIFEIFAQFIWICSNNFLLLWQLHSPFKSAHHTNICSLHWAIRSLSSWSAMALSFQKLNFSSFDKSVQPIWHNWIWVSPLQRELGSENLLTSEESNRSLPWIWIQHTPLTKNRELL